MDYENSDLKLAFTGIRNLIRNNKNELDEKSNNYIDIAKYYFNNAMNSMEPLINQASNKSYVITPSLVQTIKYFEERDISDPVQRAKRIQENFEKIISSLDELKQNPQSFYRSEDSDLIGVYFNKFSKFF